MVRIGVLAVGTCCCHPSIPYVGWVGMVISSAKNTKANNRGVARVGDIVMGCHAAMIITGSNTVITENSRTARISDLCVACPTGIHISGSEDVKLT
jgi:uncharacterized Zn-binding protein involved in type VI secretion